MPSNTQKLIQTISNNRAFTAKWPFDEKKPLDSLPWYPVWLNEQMGLMNTVAGTSDKSVILDFLCILDLNQDLMSFLGDFKITEEVIKGYYFNDFSTEDRQNLFRLYRIWIDDQFSLITNSLEEDRIQKALGAANRDHLRDNLAELGRVIAEGQTRKGEEKKEYESLEEVKRKIIVAEDLGWNPKDTSPEKLLKELNRRIEAKQKEIKTREQQLGKGTAPKSFKGTLENYRNMLGAETEVLKAQVNRLLSFNQDLVQHITLLQKAREGTVQARKKGESLLKVTKTEVGDHVKEFSKGKKGLDPYLSSTRESAQSEMEQLYEELNPLLQAISDLNNEIVVHETALRRTNEPILGGIEQQISHDELEALVKEKQKRLDAMYDRKDQIFLRIGQLQSKVNTLKTTYESQISDERQFEENARHQLNLLKTIPRIEKALNIYCSYYKGAFPLFLYVGSFVRGDGDVLHSPSLIGKGMDLLVKLPMVGAGLTDIEKCKAYDTGSMTLSLKLGLSVGVDAEVFSAKAGLAVEYNAGISVADERTFQTTAEFVLKAAAGIEIKEFFKFALEVEIAKWKGGFVFQDHYHWAAWLAARWGHFCARASACDVYLSSSNIGPDHRPDQKALDELDRLTAQFLNDNEMIQTVYAEIRQYLDYPVGRSKQSGFFESGKLNIGLLGAELETQGNFRPAEPDMMVVRNENGKAVEYEASYEVAQYGGSLSVAGYTLQITYSETKHCPVTIYDGEVLTVTFSPIPPPELWVQILDIFMGVLTGTGDVKARILTLFKETFKVALQKVITTFASKYILEKTKTMEINFFFTEGTLALQYVRTSVAFGKKFEKSVPVWEFVYVDLGAEFNYVRTFNEGLGYRSITYPQYVHHGLKGILKQKQPMEGRKIYTLRPDSMSGEELWKKWVDVHKHDLWHMFMAIGSKDSTIRKELTRFNSKSEVQALVSQCEQKASSGRYKLPGEGLVPYITGYIPNQAVQAMNVLIKHTLVMKNKDGFEDISTAYNEILPAFNSVLDAEYRSIKNEEEANFKKRFKAVLPPPKTVSQEVGQIFGSRDEQMFFDIGWASQLHQETGKAMKSCEKCLQEFKDYDLAKDMLLNAILPEKYWVDDKDSAICMACRKKIEASLFSSNKHHCRICGGIFCENCCPSRAVDASISKSKIRVCRPCFEKISAAKAGTGLPMPFQLPKPKLAKSSTAARELPRPTLRRSETPPPPQPVVSQSVQQQSSLMKTGTNGDSVPKSLMSVGKGDQQAFKPKQPSGDKKPQSGKQQVSSSGGKPKQPGPGEWYSDDHINYLMEHYLAGRHDTAVVGGISAHLHGGGTLRENLQDRTEIAFVQDQAQMVVPVNINENHWVGLYIHFTNPDYQAPTIVHVDPYGNIPAQDLGAAIARIFPRCTLQISRTRYQASGDGINCGPWTVALLEHLAKNNGTLPAMGLIDINRRRAQDRALLA